MRGSTEWHQRENGESAQWPFCSLYLCSCFIELTNTWKPHSIFFLEASAVEAQTGLICLAFSWISERESVVSSVECVLLLCSCKTTLACDRLTRVGWCYRAWRKKQPLPEVTEFYSYNVLGDANPAFTIVSLWNESPGCVCAPVPWCLLRGSWAPRIPLRFGQIGASC